MKMDDKRIQFWKDWVEDKEEKLRTPSSKDEVIRLNLLRERGIAQHAIWINECLAVIFFKMIVRIMSMQDEQMRRLEKGQTYSITKKEMKETRELHQKNVEALRILEKMLADHRAILERSSPDIV